MSSQSPSNLEPKTHGIILRTSFSFIGRYVYFPLPHTFSTDATSDLHNVIAGSLANAPHFPYITIIDSISTNILYLTYHSFPILFHVYNLIYGSHFSFPFPYLVTFVNAAILIHDSTHFKVLVVCSKEHPNLSFGKEGSNLNGPLIFYLYTFERDNWSLLPYDFSLSSHNLLPNRRKPAHVTEDIVYIDLTYHFLLSYGYSNDKIKLIPKPITTWEQTSMKLAETMRYVGSRGKLHCVKINLMQIEVHKEIEITKGLWILVVARKVGCNWGKFVGIHPDDEGLVLVRSTDTDAILIVDIQRHFSRVVVDGKGPNCGPVCFRYRKNNAVEASTSEGVQHPTCCNLHPHHIIEEPEGEVFIVSHFGTNLILLQQNACT